MKKKKKLFKMILEFLVVTLIVGFFANDIIDITYGALKDTEPDVIITKTPDGNTSYTGNLFGNELWYPDKEVKGVIRINNEFKRMKITNLGVDVDIIKTNSVYNEDTIYCSFIKDMKLTIKKGRLLSFDKTIIDNKSLGQLLYKSGNESLNGFILDKEDQFTISKNGSIDLEYTLYMDKDTGEELEAISAKVPFFINVEEKPVSSDKPNEPNDEDKVKEVMTEPIEIIPAISAHWAHDCIIALLDNEIIHGYPNDTMTIEDYRNGTIEPQIYVYEAVKPEENITRAETAELIDNALARYLTDYGEVEGNDVSKYYVDHDDISEWSKPHVLRVTVNDIMEGYPGIFNNEEYHFKPNRAISRQEMTAVLVRAFELKLENEGFEITFEDKKEIAKWAEEYIKAAVENNVVQGDPQNTFRPKDNITRAEAFTIICKLLGYHDQHNVNSD